MKEDPKNIVRVGYDQVSHVYRQDDVPIEPHYGQVLSFVNKQCLPASRVLDLGCGCGIPIAKHLARHHHVTGIDISPVQIQRACELVSEADFVCGDMVKHHWPDSTFDAVVSMYALIHIPIDEQPGLLQRIADWLTPGGWLVAIVGARAWTGTEDNWCGVEGATMYWSHAEAESYRNWMAKAGMAVTDELFIPEGDGGHTLIFAQKQA